jgi:hypothetical protein
MIEAAREFALVVGICALAFTCYTLWRSRR